MIEMYYYFVLRNIDILSFDVVCMIYKPIRRNKILHCEFPEFPRKMKRVVSHAYHSPITLYISQVIYQIIR